MHKIFKVEIKEEIPEEDDQMLSQMIEEDFSQDMEVDEIAPSQKIEEDIEEAKMSENAPNRGFKVANSAVKKEENLEENASLPQGWSIKSNPDVSYGKLF